MLENLRVVLVSPRNPLNVGAAARAMSNFGCFDLRLVNAYRKAVDEAKSAVKAGRILTDAKEFDTVAEAVADCHVVGGATGREHREFEQPYLRLEAVSRRLRTALKRGPVALLFGSEKFGLSNEDMAHCHYLVGIPTRPEHESMNLGQSVAVCLYELARGRELASFTPGKAPAHAAPADATESERITGLLLEALGESGYVRERTAGSTELKIRRLVKRMRLDRRDDVIWQGMLRQILWKLRP